MIGELIEEEQGKKDIQEFIGKRILLAEDNDLNWEIAEDIQHCLECDMNGHVAKPIDVKNLTQLLRNNLKNLHDKDREGEK